MMKHAACTGLLVASICSTAMAGDFNFAGCRANGMGGARTATARGAWSIVNNPAGLALEDVGASSRVSFSAVFDIRDAGVLGPVDELSDYDWDEITGNPEAYPTEISEIVAQLERLGRGRGLLVGVGGSAVGAHRGFGTGVDFGFRAAFIPHVDLVNTNATPPGTPGSFYTNQSAVSVRAIGLTEVPFGYGHKFETDFGTVCVGAAVKLMYGVTYDERLDPTLVNSDVRDELTDSEETTANFGLDLGAIYQPIKEVSIGLTARNVNSPKFDTYTGEISEDPALRAGIEWALWDRLVCLAFDADLNERDTILNGYKQQWVGGGVSLEGTPSVVALGLRLGAKQNIADDEVGIVYTAGFSVGFKFFHLSSSFAWSSDETSFEDSTVPADMSFAVAFESTW